MYDDLNSFLKGLTDLSSTSDVLDQEQFDPTFTLPSSDFNLWMDTHSLDSAISGSMITSHVSPATGISNSPLPTNSIQMHGTEMDWSLSGPAGIATAVDLPAALPLPPVTPSMPSAPMTITAPMPPLDGGPPSLVIPATTTKPVQAVSMGMEQLTPSRPLLPMTSANASEHDVLSTAADVSNANKENVNPTSDNSDTAGETLQKSLSGRVRKPSNHAEVMNRIGSSVPSLPLVTANPSPAIDPNSEPNWFIDAHQHLQHDELGEEWIACVKVWLEFEKGQGYGGNKKVRLFYFPSLIKVHCFLPRVAHLPHQKSVLKNGPSGRPRARTVEGTTTASRLSRAHSSSGWRSCRGGTISNLVFGRPRD